MAILKLKIDATLDKTIITKEKIVLEINKNRNPSEETIIEGTYITFPNGVKVDIGEHDIKIEALIEPITSNISPQGIVLSDSYYAAESRYSYYAFDNNTATFWEPTANLMPSYIGFQFNEKKEAYNATISGFSNAGNLPVKFKIQESNDGTEWIGVSEKLATH